MSDRIKRKSSWFETLNILFQSKSKKQKDSQNAIIPLLDTIFLGDDEDNSIEWFYTTKNGSVSKKIGDSASFSAIANRFSKFALANPNNSAKYVGALYDGDLLKQNLTAEELESLLHNILPSFKTKNTYLQVYLRPHDGLEQVVCVDYSLSQNTPFLEVNLKHNNLIQKAPKGITMKVSSIINELAKSILDGQNKVIESAKFNFLIDDNQQVWISYIENLVYSSPHSNTRENQMIDNNTFKSNENSITIENSFEVNENAHTLPGSDKSIQGSFIDLDPSDGIYKSSLCADELPGLRAWLPIAQNNQNKKQTDLSVIQWVVDLDEYTRPLNSPVEELETIRQRKSMEKYQVLLSDLLLVISCETILLGGISCRSIGDLLNAWKSSTLSAQESHTEMNSKYCYVCGNLIEIISKINNLITSKFKVASETEGILSRPSSVPYVNEGLLVLQHISRGGSAKENQSATSIENKISPSINNFTIHSKESSSNSILDRNDKTKSHPQKSDIKVGNILINNEVSIENEISKPSTPSKHSSKSNTMLKSISLLNNNEENKITSANNQNYRLGQLNSLYSDELPKQRPVLKKKSNLKGKKINDTLTQKTFNKSSMRNPPNIEMIAEFAAEKERYKSEMENIGSDMHNEKFKSMKKLSKNNQEPIAVGYGEDTFDVQDDISISKQIEKNRRHRQVENKLKSLKPIKNENYFSHEIDGHLPPLLTDLPPLDYVYPALGGDIQMMGSVNSIGGGISVISGSEANFMLRQAESGDLSQLSLIGHEDGFPLANSAANVDNTSHLFQKVNEKMKDRIDSLEKQVKALSGTIERRDIELEKAREKELKIISELEFLRKENTRELKECRERYEKDILMLKENHAKDMAIIVNGVEINANNINNSIENSINDSKSKVNNGQNESVKGTRLGYTTSSETNFHLIKQLEDMRIELQKAYEKSENEKKSLMIESNAKLLNQEKQSKSELIKLRSELLSSEDKYTASQYELQESQAQQEALARMCQQLEKSRQDSLDAQAKLRADLTNLQQTINATYRLESSQGLGVGVDADTAIRLAEAKYEAKERKLQNKIEFLKAQLDTEQESSEELKKNILAGRQKLDELRDEFKLRMREAEKEKQAAIEETERRLESQYEERMSELTSLQSKMMMLQNQLQDSLQDNSLSKQKEEAAKLATAKALAYQAATRTEADQLKKQIEEMRKLKEDESDIELNKYSNEAVMRRLDNERQYLKSQLSSEITHKNELQTTLNQCQTQLAELQRQWKADVDSLRDILSSSQQEAIQIEQSLMAKNLNFESENLRLSTQCKDLKESLGKMRDQYRMDQIAVENIKASNKSLQSEIENARTEIARIKQKEQEESVIHKNQLKAFSSTLQEVEQKNSKEMSILKTELSKQYTVNSDAQQIIIQLKDQVDQTSSNSNKKAYIYQVIDLIRRWKRTRLYGAFKVWSTNSTLIGVAEQFRNQVDNMVVNMKSELSSEKESAIDDVRSKLKAEEEGRVATLIREYELMIDKIKKDLEDDKVLALNDAYEEFQKHLDEKESIWATEKDNLIANCETNLTNLLARKDTEVEEMKHRNHAEMENSIREAQLNFQKELIDTRQNCETEWKEIINSREKELFEQFDRERISIYKENEAKQKELTISFNESTEKLKVAAQEHLMQELSNLRKIHEEELKFKEEELNNAFKIREQELKCEEESAIKRVKSQAFEDSEARIRELRQVWNEELQSLLKIKESDLEELTQKRLNELSLNHEKEKQSIIKLETAKWQQALRDAEKRYLLEAKKAQSQGYAQREKELQDEVKRIEMAHEFDMAKKTEIHKKLIEETLSEHANTIVKMNNDFERDKAQLLERSERELTNRLNLEWSEKMKVKVDEAWADASIVWQSKIDRESQRLESFKADTLKQSQHIANERNDLLQRISKNDDLIKSIEAVKDAELINVKNDFEKERMALVAKYDKLQKELTIKYEEETKSKIESLEVFHADKLQRSLKLEREKVTDEMDDVIKNIQEEANKNLSTIQKLSDEQKRLITSINLDLSNTSKNLQDTEDKLFNEQKNFNDAQKLNSFTLWRISTGVIRMKLRFKEGIAELEANAKDELESVKSKASNELNETKLNLLKLSCLLVGVESTRKKINSTLVSYKTEFLIEKRSHIKYLEKEIDKLTTERDACEELRDNIEDDISNLEISVGDIEEQIRDHNRTSTMQNGRVNVAHARKKRRLDSELERVLETIEQKRTQMTASDEKIADLTRQRDEKENELIDLEKDLVSVLVEQQKLVMGICEEIRVVEEKNRTILTVLNLAWPPPSNPTLKDVSRQNE